MKLAQKTLSLLLTVTALTGLMACGGGGGDSSDKTAPKLVSASTDTAGKTVVLAFDDLLSTTTAPAGAFSVAVAGANATITGVTANATGVTLTLGTAIAYGQTVTATYTAPASDATTSNAAIQDAFGNDAASFSSSAVSNKVANPNAVPAGVSVSLNGAAATPSANGEFTAAIGTKVTVQDAQSRLGNSSSSSKDASGNNAATSMSIHSMSATRYEVTVTNAPAGGLTSIEFSSVPYTLKMRWQ